MHIAVLIPYEPPYSETFITRRIDAVADSVCITNEHILLRLAQKGMPLNVPFILYTRLQDALRKQLGVFWYPLERRVIRNHIRAHKPDVVLAEYGKVGVQAQPICAARSIPLVVHFHGYDAYRGSALREYKRAYQKMFETMRAAVALSRPMQEQLIALGAPQEKVHYIPNGLDLAAFTPTTPSKNPSRLLAVGRFVEKKSPERTVRAFAQVAADFPDATLTMIGDGTRRRACAELARELRVAERVTFLGKQDHETVKKEMQEARIFVQHSIQAQNGDSEGMPNTVLEASATGLPVVATRHGGIPGIVAHGETGLLVAEKDVEGMAEAIRTILADPAYGDALGKAGRARIENHFDLRTTAGELRALLESTKIG